MTIAGNTAMTDHMTEERLAEIEARANAATQGPWYFCHGDDQMCMNTFYVSTSPDNGDDPREIHGEIVAVTLYQAERCACHDAERWSEDATFIAHARSDIPALIAEVRRLREQVGALVELIKAQGSYCNASMSILYMHTELHPNRCSPTKVQLDHVQMIADASRELLNEARAKCRALGLEV